LIEREGEGAGEEISLFAKEGGEEE